jgi:putative transposase
MKAGEMTDQQIVEILQEAQSGKIGIVDLCQAKGISEATVSTWRKKIGAMPSSEARRVKELEKENARLKRLLAERDLDIDILKETPQKNF